MNHLVPEHIRTLKPYQPGKPIEETQREYKIRKVVKLASNENPLGPSPKALAATKKELKNLHRYPDGSGFRLKKALSRTLKVKPEEILLGNGSNEVIDMVLRTFTHPGDSVVTSKAAFVAFRICAQIHGLQVIETELDSQLKFNLKSMFQAVRDQQNVKLVYIPNPNNPTGTYVSTQELYKFLEDLRGVRGGEVRVILDYAYWEYVVAKDLPDPMELRKKYPNVIVTRTFSKIYGLAGLRLGYGLADADSIEMMNRVREPFNVNNLALVAAEAALSDKGFVARARKLNLQGRKFWYQQLDKMGVKYVAGEGNFVLVDIFSAFEKNAQDLYTQCLQMGLIVRPVANYGLPGYLRVSYGTPAENQFAVKVLRQLLPSKSRAAVVKTAKARKTAKRKKK